MVVKVISEYTDDSSIEELRMEFEGQPGYTATQVERDIVIIHMDGLKITLQEVNP